MKSSRTKIVKELKAEEIEGLSQSKIESYLNMGYKPYLDSKGNIKWLTQAQYDLRTVERSKSSSFRRSPKMIKPVQSKSKRYRKSFLREYWLTLIIVILIAIAVLIIIKFPHLIF